MKNVIDQLFISGLEKNPSSDEDESDAIWNGNEFIFLGNDWASMMKLLWRYGIQIFKFKKYLQII